MKKILIVEDDKKLREELSLFLTNNGFLVQLLTDFCNSIIDIKNINCDLILLDINLPNYDGQYICKELRKEINTPIIILTSKNTELDEILSINYGADDFLTKPYKPQVLLARINRIFNRNKNDEKVEYNNLVLDISKSIIIYNNKELDLTKNELKILYFLMKNNNIIISRDELMDYLWNDSQFIDDNTLTVNINRLRNKLIEIGVGNMIGTKRNMGYILK